MTVSLIKVSGLSHKFNGTRVLDNLELTVPQGSIYGFLGPNGAGKTTTLRLILGLLARQEGSIELFGEDQQEHRSEHLKRIGSLIEQPSLYGHLTGKENLELYRNVLSVPANRVHEMLKWVGLEGAAAKKAKSYSLGMKQRLALAVSLLHDPELLILDEPTNGLDPGGIIENREMMKTLNREQGKTILVSSHLLGEVEKLVTHIGIIHKGVKQFEGSLQDLQLLRTSKSILRVRVDQIQKARQVLGDPMEFQSHGHDEFSIPWDGDMITANLNRKLVESGIQVYLLEHRKNDLENLFMDLTA
jgi:lantibiotic transport system ATP-binding protein